MQYLIQKLEQSQNKRNHEYPIMLKEKYSINAYIKFYYIHP